MRTARRARLNAFLLGSLGLGRPCDLLWRVWDLAAPGTGDRGKSPRRRRRDGGEGRTAAVQLLPCGKQPGMPGLRGLRPARDVRPNPSGIAGCFCAKKLASRAQVRVGRARCYNAGRIMHTTQAGHAPKAVEGGAARARHRLVGTAAQTLPVSPSEMASAQRSSVLDRG